MTTEPASGRFSTHRLFAALEDAEPITDPRHPQMSGGAGSGIPTTFREAAVLILLSDEDDTSVLLTRRALTMRKHAGQVSFPGGKRDGNETAVHTALREAHEEIGLDPAGVQLRGTLPAASLPVTSFAVTPVIGTAAREVPLGPWNPAEVASVHHVPVSELVAPANRAIGLLPGKDGRGVGRKVGSMFICGDIVIWGFTAMLLDGLLRLAGWEEEWDRERKLFVPKAFVGRT